MHYPIIIIIMIPKFEAYGFCTVWENSIALLNFQKIINNFSNLDLLTGLALKTIRTIEVEKLGQI